MNLKKIIALIILGALSFSFSIFEKTKWVWHKNEYNYVKLAKPDKEIGKLEHPADISPEQILKVLTSIKYQRALINLGALGKPKEYDLFTKEEAEIITPYISQAFKEANSSQWVDFSIEVHRGPGLIFGSDQLTDGVLFIKNGKLNIAFRNISMKLGVDDTPNIVSPIKAYPGSAKLIPKENQELAKNKKGKNVYNWLIIDLNPQKDQTQELKKTESEKTIETQKPESQSTQAPSEQTQPKPQKSIKERLTELRELYDQGLISEEEYNKKREEILKEL